MFNNSEYYYLVDAQYCAFVEDLKATAKARKVTAEKVAAACGVSRQAVENWKISLSFPRFSNFLTWTGTVGRPLHVELNGAASRVLSHEHMAQELKSERVRKLLSMEEVSRRLKGSDGLVSSWERDNCHGSTYAMLGWVMCLGGNAFLSDGVSHV